MAETKSSVTETNQNFMEFYDELWSLRDRRVDDWWLMSSPWPTITLCAAYWYCSIVLGPVLMKNRPAIEVKIPMQIYNVFQVIISAYICYEAAMAGWLTHYNPICQAVELDTDPNSTGMRMARVCHLYFLSKFLEFADTFFFIARKKFSHVSRLQLIHHGIMPMFGYLLTRWLPGGQESFGGMLNSLVHVVMYSYYFLAALGPHMQKYLWWKKYLTTFQMLQFTAIFCKSMIIVLGFAECGFPWQFSALFASLMALFFCLFAEFYVQEYLNKKSGGKKIQPKAE